MENSHYDKALFCFEVYRSIKLHLTNTWYDYFKYKGHSLRKSEIKNFATNNAYPFCDQLSRRRTRQEIVEFILSVLIMRDDVWLDELPNKEDMWIDWKKRQESLSYLFVRDVNKLFASHKPVSSYFKSHNGEYPEIVVRYMQGDMIIETLAILDLIFNFIDRLLIEYANDLFLYDKLLKVKKYEQFVSVYHKLGTEKKKFQIIVKQKIDENLNVLPF